MSADNTQNATVDIAALLAAAVENTTDADIAEARELAAAPVKRQRTSEILTNVNLFLASGAPRIDAAQFHPDKDAAYIRTRYWSYAAENTSSKNKVKNLSVRRSGDSVYLINLEVVNS